MASLESAYVAWLSRDTYRIRAQLPIIMGWGTHDQGGGAPTLYQDPTGLGQGNQPFGSTYTNPPLPMGGTVLVELVELH